MEANGGVNCSLRRSLMVSGSSGGDAGMLPQPAAIADYWSVS